MNPEGGTTGNTLFYINEQFVNKEAVGRHVENAQKNSYFEKFGGIMKEYGVAVGLGTEIYASIRNWWVLYANHTRHGRIVSNAAI